MRAHNDQNGQLAEQGWGGTAALHLIAGAGCGVKVRPYLRKIILATPNYGYEKRQKELAKKRKKEDKLKSKTERKVGGDGETAQADDMLPPAYTPPQADPGTAQS